MRWCVIKQTDLGNYISEKMGDCFFWAVKRGVLRFYDLCDPDCYHFRLEAMRVSNYGTSIIHTPLYVDTYAYTDWLPISMVRIDNDLLINPIDPPNDFMFFETEQYAMFFKATEIKKLSERYPTKVTETLKEKAFVIIGSKEYNEYVYNYPDKYMDMVGRIMI